MSGYLCSQLSEHEASYLKVLMRLGQPVDEGMGDVTMKPTLASEIPAIRNLVGL
jgi:hypothetical protein